MTYSNKWFLKAKPSFRLFDRHEDPIPKGLYINFEEFLRKSLIVPQEPKWSWRNHRKLPTLTPISDPFLYNNILKCINNNYPCARTPSTLYSCNREHLYVPLKSSSQQRIKFFRNFLPSKWVHAQHFLRVKNFELSECYLNFFYMELCSTKQLSLLIPTRLLW